MNDTAGQAPHWASFFAPNAWAMFVAAVANDLRARGLGHRIDAEEGCVHIDAHGERGPHVAGLTNLAQACHANDPSRWAHIVHGHFDTLFDPSDGVAAEAIAADWSRAQGFVKLRLYRPDGLPPEASIVAWPMAAGLLAVVTLDMPSTVVTVRKEDRARWPVDDGALYRRALDNVRADGRLTISTNDIGDGASIQLIGSQSFFAASHVLFLEDYLGGPMPYGALVAVPHRHCVLFHPIVDMRVIKAVNTMIPVAAGMFHEGPGSITSQLFWWRSPGAFLHLPSNLVDRTIQFYPPAEFVTLLNSLAGTRT
jgi:hypothetical protein